MNKTKCFFCDNELDYSDEPTDPAICSECCNDREKTIAIAAVLQARQALNDSLKALTKIKFKGEPLRITNVFVFSNQNTAVTDQFGEQMSEYQGRWDDVKQKIYAQVNLQDKKPMFHDAFGVDKVVV